MDWSLLLPSTWNPWIAYQRLFSSDPQVAPQALSSLFILVIIGLALFFSCWAIKLAFTSLSQTGRYLKRLPKAGQPANLLDSSKLPLFREFRQYLITIPNRDGTKQSSLRRTVDANEIFRHSTLAPNFTSSRLFLGMPGILTGLGVLGTFVGLQIGIGGLDLSDPRILEKSIVPLIQGCVIAFSTSVWGVLASLLFSGFEKTLDRVALQRIRSLQNRVDTLYQRYVPEEAMAELERASRGTEEILKGLAIAIGEQMQKAINQLGNEIKEAVTKATREGQGSLMEKSSELLSETITAELGNLKTEISEMGKQFRNQFTGASDDLMKSVREFQPTVKTLSQAVDVAQENVTNAVEKLNAHEGVMDKMAKFAEELHQSTEAFAEMKDTLQLSAENNKQAAEAQLSSALANKQVADKFDKVGERLPTIEKTLNDAAQVIASISDPVSELKAYLEKLPGDYEENERNRTASEDGRNKRLLEMTGDLAEKVGKAAEQFSKVDTLANKLADAAITLEDASNGLATFGHHVSDASQSQRKASDAALSAALSGERTAHALEPLSDDFKRLTVGLQTAGEKVKEGAEKSYESYNQLIKLQKQWFDGAELGLNAMKDRLQSIIDAYGDQIEGNTKNLMKQWTDEVSVCLKTYQGQVEQLQEDLDALQDSISKMNKS
jgi:methyl-accepting chemotaxis protein